MRNETENSSIYFSVNKYANLIAKYARIYQKSTFFLSTTKLFFFFKFPNVSFSPKFNRFLYNTQTPYINVYSPHQIKYTIHYFVFPSHIYFLIDFFCNQTIKKSTQFYVSYTFTKLSHNPPTEHSFIKVPQVLYGSTVDSVYKHRIYTVNEVSIFW